MSTVTFTQSETMVCVECCECGITFGMPQHFNSTRREDKKTFYCPNGHPQVYRESEVDRLRKQLQAKESEVAREKARTDQAKADAAYQHKQRIEAEKSLVATKGVVTKLKKRGAAGVCPCCNRTVKQMAEHLAEKHPEYVLDQGITPKPRIRPMAK